MGIRTTIKKTCLILDAIYLTRLSRVRLLTKIPVNNHIGFRHPLMFVSKHPKLSQSKLGQLVAREDCFLVHYTF